MKFEPFEIQHFEYGDLCCRQGKLVMYLGVVDDGSYPASEANFAEVDDDFDYSCMEVQRYFLDEFTAVPEDFWSWGRGI